MSCKLCKGTGRVKFGGAPTDEVCPACDGVDVIKAAIKQVEEMKLGETDRHGRWGATPMPQASTNRCMCGRHFEDPTPCPRCDKRGGAIEGVLYALLALAILGLGGTLLYLKLSTA